jgi:predicted nucleotidyltransferase
MMDASHPTPHDGVNLLLADLVSGVTAILGDRIVAIYLDGSLANGDFDASSDIDFVVVTEDAISAAMFVDLRVLHEGLNAMDSHWATQLEGSYLSRRAIRRHDPANTWHPNIERGQGERLKMSDHDEGWMIHRHILRERGIVIRGPEPRALIDPVSPDALRSATVGVLRGWASHLLEDPQSMHRRPYQSYVVLSLCRVFYTLEFGDVVSKRAAADWAQRALGERWRPLIRQAWVNRQRPDAKASTEDMAATLGLIRFALERGRRYDRLLHEV